MKLRLLGVLLLVPALALWSCEDSGEGEVTDEAAVEGAEGAAGEAGEAGEAGAAEGGEAAAGEEGGEAAAAAPGPADVCATIVEAVKAAEEAKILENSTAATGEMMAAPEAKAGMMAALKEATCGEATEAEDGASATVAVTAGEETRNIPFAKVEDAWKFDGEAYAKAYPPPAEEKGKKKKKKGKKKKGKKKKAK